MSGGHQAAAGSACGAPGLINPSIPDSTGGLAAVFTIGSDGVLTYNEGAATTNWVTPASSAIAALYQVKVHVDSGTLAGGVSAVDTWLDCSTGPGWGVVTPSDAVITVSIREKVSTLLRTAQSVTLTTTL